MCVFQKNKQELALGDDIGGGTSSANLNGPLRAENLKFSVKVEELKELMQLKGVEATDKLNNNLGGTEGLAARLNTDLASGLTEDANDLKNRVDLYGKNEIPPKPPKSIFRLAFEAVQDATLIMLIICAVISIGLSFYHPADDEKEEEFRNTKSEDVGNLEWVEGVAIMIAVIVVVFVTAFNDWRKERQFRGLQDRIESDNLTSVVRNGQIKQINIKDLVVGDICCIKYGDLTPADGIVVQASDLKIDESSLTGETDQIKKTPTQNITILSGTHVMEGSGKFLVLAVGLNSQTGIIMTLLGATKEEEGENSKKSKTSKVSPDLGTNSNETPLTKKEKKKKKKVSNKKHRSVLQIKLGKLALQIGYGGMLSALLTFIILVGITVIVVAVPEGLPLAVTLALAFAVRRMTKDNNLVRHLDACETMGNATTICSDKTGTLTTNRMTVVQCWIGGVMYTTLPEKSQVNETIKTLLFESISTNSSYTTMIEPPTQAGEMPKYIGNKTECGLLGLVLNLGGSYESIRGAYPNDKFEKVFTFNSERKMMSTLIKLNDSEGFRLHAKGAPEILLSKCSYYLDSDGSLVELTQDKIEDFIKNVIEPMATDGLRTLCVASKDFKPSSNSDQKIKNISYYENLPDWNDEPEIVKGLTCLSIVGIEDPVRPEVPDAIRKCQQSGVVVRMVTGDNVSTATSIAIKCGILKPSDDYLILESKEFNRRIRDINGEVNQDLLDQVWPKLRVLARSSPQDKYILVNGIVESKLSANREVVAVTGDGTNDGPALKRADVGFAMGIQGTDVAKEASDIILTDDNFSSIVKAMMWGRNVYDAIAKFLQFQLTANFAAGLFSVVCAATIQAVPLKAVQMLWVNLVMDTLASLALATEPPTEDLLKRKPYGRNKSIISLTMLRNMIGHTIYQLIVLFTLVWAIEDWMDIDSIIKYDDLVKIRDPSLHFTIIFNAFVLMTLFNELNARKIHNERNIFDGIQKNFVFLVIWIFCLGGQILIVNFGGIVFAVKPIEWDHWMWCLFLGFGSLLWGQLVTTVPKSVVKKLFKLFKCFGCCCKCKKAKKSEKISAEIKTVETELNMLSSDEKEIYDDRKFIDDSKVSWVRGANRVQNQLNVVDDFQQNVDKSDDRRQSLYASAISLKSMKSTDNEKL